MNTKILSILSLGVLLVLGAVFVSASEASEVSSLTSCNLDGGIQPLLACNNFCAYCIPITGGSCNFTGSCC